MASVLFNGQKLEYIEFHNRPCLWITSPSQKKMDKMEFVGGYPDEYCIFIDKLTKEEKDSIVFI